MRLEMRLIEQIKNNNKAISLIKVGEVFEVTTKLGVERKTNIFTTLVDALREFNIRAENFEQELNNVR